MMVERINNHWKVTYQIIYIKIMSSQQSSSEQSVNVTRKKVKKVPVVMEPYPKVKVKTKQIVINLSMTKYQVITVVAQQLEWKIQHTKKNDWDILWTDSMIDPQLLMKMHFYQKVSHFPGIHVLARKNLLGLSFMEMNRNFPSQYNFFPKTWMLPSDYPEFRQQVEKGQHHCYIVKPQADCQGRGIFLTFKTQDIQNGKHYVIQEYVSRPFLVDGLKFDFRVYVLLCGTNPMRLYIYEEGLARFATEPYDRPKKSNLKNKCMHLTNYAINKKNPKFVFNKSAKNMSEGHKRSLSSVFEKISQMGLNVMILKQKIYDVIVKTIILGQPLVSHQYKFAQPDDEYKNMCFHILGIDVMINQLMNPVVLEVNHTPSFATDTPLDFQIKHDLIKDTLILMNVTTEKKKELVKKTNNYQRQRIINAKRLVESGGHKQKILAAQVERDNYENDHLGKYKKIYPVQDENRMRDYQQFLKAAEKSYFSENNIIRTQIQAQKDKISPQKKEKPTQAKTNAKINFKTQKKIEQKNKNHSTQIFRQENNFFQGQFTTKSYFSIAKNRKNQQIGMTKALNSIADIDQRIPYKTTNKFPKLNEVQSSPMKNQMNELQKSHYINLRKKKMIQNKEGKKSYKNFEVKEGGVYLVPKVVMFDSYNQEDLFEFQKFQEFKLKSSLKGSSCFVSKKYD